jgi:Fe-S-cluster-containing dehydrogenase component
VCPVLSGSRRFGGNNTGIRAKGLNEMKFDMRSCGGCRTCEIACSFHHSGEFNPTISSIKILDKVNEPGFIVLLVEKNDGKSIACDFCEGIEVPLCVQYCKEKEELAKMINELKQKKESMTASRATAGFSGRSSRQI